MSELINLVPDYEKTEQQKVKVVKASTIISILVLLIVVGVSAYFYYVTDGVNKQLAELDAQIVKLRGNITALSEIEITARNLYKKYTSLKEIYSSRYRYSILAREFALRTTPGILILDFGLDEKGNIMITGIGENYLQVAKFMKDLTDTSFGGASKGFEAIFKSVTLNSVTLSNSENQASFSLTVTYDTNLIKN